AGVPVGRRAEEDSLFADPDPPRVIVRAPQKFEFRAIGTESIEPRTERQPFAIDGSIETRIPNDAVDPVVEPVMQIARAGVRIARGPAGEQDAALVGYVVAVYVLEEQHVGSLTDDEPPAGKRDARGNAELLGEDSELVGPAVAVGVFTNSN